MRGRADHLVPTAGIFKDNAAFFRRGASGAGRETLGAQELAGYRARVAQLAPPDLIAWLHRDQRLAADRPRRGEYLRIRRPFCRTAQSLPAG